MVWWLMSAYNPFMPFALGMAGVSDEQDKQITSSASAPAQAHMHSLAQHGLQACCVWSEGEGFHHFSDNWTKVTGQMPSDCMSNHWEESMHPDSRREFDLALADLFSPDPCETIDHVTIECQIARGDGYWSWQQLTLIPMPAHHQRSVSVLVCDITQQRQLQDTAAAALRESAHATQSRASFLSSMSHELRTPLNAILGFAQMLEGPAKMEPQQALEYLTYIRESGEDLLTKINDLIEISNIDAHCAKLHEEPLNLCDIIHASLEMSSHTAFARSVSIAQDIQVPQLVLQGDRAKLIHIINHLLTNAIRHSAIGESVHIRANASMRDGLFLSIQDKGCGIAPGQLRNIQQALQARQPYYSTDIGNVGLGLSIAKEFAELHGGRLTIESVAQHGTIVTMQLPPARILSLSARVKPKAKKELA